MLSPAFNLLDHDRNPVTEQSFEGRLQLVFFGFTNCRSVCPRALGKLSDALELLGTEADWFAPLYITVDPERDTPAMMRGFLRSYPRFTGLTGTAQQIQDARQNFRVFANRVDRPEGGYDMPHTAFTYALATDGNFLDHWPEVLTVDEIAARLRLLIQTHIKEVQNG